MPDGELERVEVVDYDNSWPATFQTEREVLAFAIAEYVVGSIEHVGSTSIPGLAAKPIIDIQVGVAGLDEARPTFEALESIGYCYDSGVCPHVMHFFDKRLEGEQPYNLQLIPYRSECWNLRIAFRDYLRSHPDVADEYSVLKQELAQRFVLDRAAYGKGKDSFIRSVVKQAMSC